MLESFLWSCQPLACKCFKKRLKHKCFPVKSAELLRIPILRNICKRLLLDVFYKKAVLKTFTVFTGWKKLVISVLRKSCSWWLIELWQWRVFILIKISRKKRWGGGQKSRPPKNLWHISYNDETWHSYTLPKKDLKSIWIT